MTPFSLVIFDCDGVLVDSERITCQVLAQCLNELGLHLEWQEVLRLFVGKSIDKSMDMIGEMLGERPSENMWRIFAERANTALRNEVTATPHIEAALDQLALPYCVASNGDFAKMNTTLGATGLLPRFEEKMFSATQVSQGKPAPDLFLFAAHSLGHLPQNCIVVEDSPTGVAAAIAAGMTPLGYTLHMPPEELAHAGAVLTFDDMAQLPALIKQLQSATK